jgi:REP element-mobilizing transposase RayT
VGRAARSIDPEIIYHVVSKGNNAGPIAFDAVDRASLVRELDVAGTRYGLEVYAWCVLTTHYHVVLRAPSGHFSDAFRDINGIHSRRTGRRHGWTGHLVRNRFYSVAVRSVAHFVAALIYVVRNPLAAGLCREAGEWAHSSYRVTVGYGPAPQWFARDAVLAQFGRTPEAARLEYARLVHGGHLPVSDTRDPAA